MEATVNILSFVLDDDQEELDLIKEMLDKHEMTNYTLFTDPDKFMNNITADIHICIIDHFLPRGKTGLDLCKEIKRVSKDSFVTIITGQTSKDVIIDYLNNCADKYVDKSEDCYLDKLRKFMIEGMEYAQRRLDEIETLKMKREEIKNRRKHFEPHGDELDTDNY